MRPCGRWSRQRFPPFMRACCSRPTTSPTRGAASGRSRSATARRKPRIRASRRFSFDTGGVTAHITQSLATISRYAPSGTAPDCQGAIGVTSDSVEGTDITVPVYNFTETHYLPIATVTGAYKAALFQLTGKVNNAPFKGFATGEVLFLGASGSQRGADDWEITYRFAASPNVTGLAVGPITGINKKGWEYLWVRYADAEDQNVLVKATDRRLRRAGLRAR